MCDYMHSCFLLHGVPMADEAMRQQSVLVGSRFCFLLAPSAMEAKEGPTNHLI